MVRDIHEILSEYWGFESFRPMQENIIRSVLEGNDTLALLPTGGGKSICFQVPAMAKEGLCIVVTPLIALMKDQVQNLKDRGIKAVALNHGLSRLEIDIALDNCIYGNDFKFLYLSPERLQTELLRTRLPKMKVNLLAVDEAHCISQWGYDFRPPYLKIAEIREFFPQVPVLALTATATPQVVDDIQEKLLFRKKNLFQKSFERKNLAYVVQEEEAKLGRLLRICKKVPGTGIVYVRNRKRTREIAEYLKKNKIKADYYHAGLTPQERDLKQNSWMKEKIRVMVATNAFGMGIDKPNVRFVVHVDLPDSPEAYFQEAGRAGRDDEKAYGVTLYNKADLIDLEQNHERSYPPIEFIKKVYNCLGNFFQVPVGGGRDQTFTFVLNEFAENFNLEATQTFNALKFLEKEGFLILSDALLNPSRAFFSINREELYRFQITTPSYDNFIKVMLRSYPGILSGFVKINESDIAKRVFISREELIKRLNYLKQLNIIQYEPQNDNPTITLVEERIAIDHLRITPEVYHRQKKFSLDRLNAMKSYVENNNQCRSVLLLAYFGEHGGTPCGHCDFCIERKKTGLTKEETDKLVDEIRHLLLQHPMNTPDLLLALAGSLPERETLLMIRWLVDNGKIKIQSDSSKLEWIR
ncbi:MAG TPA: ATP-dependent DNA helicase RecQ [Bacteroidales bacterium]|nr:ATP-dependent DNA helicase RecQ [Bacteroidales bacterium]